ncbi:A-kinase anchor protein 12 [Elgaria multicarinata webbii]|uniref:A-kinase anchor protein 12 n=1 Tax=Elgaria multicarinata webbii TaxID=159646 RepID=UPI002FCCD733
MLGTITITVGQRETANVILKEESTENMETKPPESVDKTNVDDEQKDTQDADKLSPLSEEKAEEMEQPSESPSNDVGFKKVFKLVGFKFTVRKDKTEKVEPVQLLNVKADDTEVTSDGAGDYKEVKMETEEESTQSEGTPHVEKTEQETQTDQMKEETSPEEIIESPVEAGSKEAEFKNNGNKSPESPTSPLTSETASPLRKFFTHGWAGFRKKTSFRKPKEEEQQANEKEKQEKEVSKEDTTIKEELEKEKNIPEQDKSEASEETRDEKVEKEREEREETKMIDVSTETHQEEAVTPSERPSTQEFAESVNKESKISLNEKIDLASEEKSEPAQACLIALEQSTLASSEKKSELAAPLTDEVFEEKIEQSGSTFPRVTKKPEEIFESVEDNSEPKAPLATEYFDEKPTEINTDVSTVVKKEEPTTTKKEELVLKQLVGTGAEIQRGEPTDEQLKVKETLPEIVNEELKQTETSSVEAATSKPPEDITNEVELLSSQERAKLQGSPLKKLFTSSSLKKLSAKKHKGKREETKSGEAAEQIHQLSDSAESPEDPRAESSASSPEEATESVEKITDAAQITETEEGSTSDVEKKRESVTPWASFKKMVTPKKRVRRLSESDKEEELDKAKSATLSSTESAPCEEQEDIKENGEEQKLEKSTDEPKRKVDTSVSWEALICVGSSKKRTRKSSSSDEEIGQRFAQEGQKIDEGAPNKETGPDMTFTSLQESDQGQVSSSPEQAGSPSEGEGVSTWESFKRLVTPRRKSKTKMEERNEESVTVPSLEHSTSDGDSGKEESWVSFKKLMPGRRKKKSDGIPEHAPVQEAGEEVAETNEEDSDIPAVVPLSEYEAAEQEKFEAQKMKQGDIPKKTSDQSTEKSEGTLIIEQSSEGLVHAITVTVVEGERAVTSIEERSPSWISAAMTESIEHANEDEEKQTEQISGTGIVEETVVVTNVMPEIKKDISGDTIISELELTSEAITAREEASGVEEATEVSCAEETTEMVSAVSRLTESPDTTEIATPVQEAEESQQSLEELNKQTQEILQEVAERVKLSDEAEVMSESTSEVIIQPLSVEKIGQQIAVILVEPALKETELTVSPLKEEKAEKTDIQIDEDTESCQGQVEVNESSLKEVLEKINDVCVEVEESSKESIRLDRADEIHHPKIKQELLERPEETIEKQMVEETSEEEEFVIVTVTPEEDPEVKVGDTAGKQPMPLEEKENEEYCSANIVQEVKMSLEETAQDGVSEDVVPKVDESTKVACEEESPFSQKSEDVVNIVPDLVSEWTETIAVGVKEALPQNEVKDSKLLIEPPNTEAFVLEAPIQSKITEVPVQNAVTKISETASTEEVGFEACIQNKDPEISVETVETEPHVQKMEPEVQLPKLETKISVADMKPEPQAETVEKEMPIQKVETNGHVEEVQRKSQIQSVEAEVLAEKAELTVDVEFPTEKPKTESTTEVDADIKESEALFSAEKAHTQFEVEASTKKVDVEVDTEKVAEVVKTKIEAETSIKKVESEALTERMEVPIQKAEVLTGKADAAGHVDASTDKEEAKLEAEVSAEKLDSKMDVEASKEKAGAMLEAEAPSKKAEVEAPSEQGDAKLDKEAPAVKMDVESLAEKADSEVTKEKSDVDVPTVKVDVEHSTEEVKVESSIQKAEAEIFIEKAEGEHPIKKSEAKAGAEVFAEKVDAKMDVKAPAEKVDEEVPAEQSKEMVEVEATEQTEPKEILKNMEHEVRFQCEVEDITKSVATCVEVISGEAPTHIDSEQASVASDMTAVPVQKGTQAVAPTLKTTSFVTVITEEPLKCEVKAAALALEKISTEQAVTEEPKQDAMDLTQAYAADARPTLESQRTEGRAAETQERNELKDVTLVESKCSEESYTPVQKEVVSPPVKTEVVTLKSMGPTASEGPMQKEKEDALTLESTCTEAEIAEDTVQSEATVDFVKKELGNTELMTETESTGTVITEAAKTEVGGDLPTSDCEGRESFVSNAILEHKRDSTLPDVKSEGREAGVNGMAVKIETRSDKLPLETVCQLSESIGASDSCQRRQALTEKALIIETEKSSEIIELAGGDIVFAAPVQQELFAEQQEAVTEDIPEVQSYAAHKSSVTVAAAAVEEQVIAENVTFTETSAETLQTSLEMPKETVFKMVQQVSFAHSGPAALGLDTKAVSWSEKADSVVEEQVLPTGRCTKDDLIQKPVFDSIPETKLQKSESGQEAEKRTTPQRSPSLTHIEFQKDVVQSVTIESQSTKIVLKIIQNAVDKLEETEEPASASKQPSGPYLMDVNKFEIQEEIQTGQQFSVKGREEKNLEIEQSTIILKQPAEKQETFKTAEKMPLTSDKSEDRESCGSRKAEADLNTIENMSQTDEQSCTVPTLVRDPGSMDEVVKEIGLQKENGEPKFQSELDTAAPAETQRRTLEGTVSGDVPKESLDVGQPKLKDIEVGQTVHNQEQLIEQQTHVKRKEDRSQSTGFVETHREEDINKQDYTSCESSQLKSELTES